MKVRNIFIRTVLAIVVWLSICTPVFADPLDEADTESVPIDGGLSLLLAAGVGYGLKKARDGKKASSNKSDPGNNT